MGTCYQNLSESSQCTTYTSAVNGKQIEVGFSPNSDHGTRVIVEFPYGDYVIVPVNHENFRVEHDQLSLLHPTTKKPLLYYSGDILAMLYILRLRNIDIEVSLSHPEDSAFPLCENGVMPFYEQIQNIMKETEDAVDTIIVPEAGHQLLDSYSDGSCLHITSGLHPEIKLWMGRYDTQVFYQTELNSQHLGIYPKIYKLFHGEDKKEAIFSARRSVCGSSAKLFPLLEKILPFGPGTIWAPKGIQSNALMRIGEKKVLNPRNNNIYKNESDEVFYNLVLRICGVLAIFLPQTYIQGNINTGHYGYKEYFQAFSKLKDILLQSEGNEKI